jgi:pimeloyl-ACP methyl ester carboxylesterase
MNLEQNVKMPVSQRKPIPVLLLHGAWHAAWCYDLWLDDFAAHGYETHVMSLPAHGKSGKAKSINLYSMADYTEALSQIVEQIQPTPFVIAHSLGGFILQNYLKTHQLPGAVLLASVPVNGFLPFFLRYFLRHPLRFLQANLTMKLDLLVNTPQLVRKYLITDQAAFTPEQLAQMIQVESLRVGIEGCFVVRGNPKLVKTPMLVVSAEFDGIFTPKEQRYTAEAYHADFLQIDGQGHNLMIERDWQQTAAKIREWLDRRQTPD